MTKATYRKNYNELLKKTVKMLRDYREAALKSGAIDLESDKTAYTIPKNVMCAALQECRGQWAPLTIDRDGGFCKENKNEKEIKNIYTMTVLP